MATLAASTRDLFAILGLAALAPQAEPGQQATTNPIRSVGVMTFVDVDTVVIADWRAGALHALDLAPAKPAAPTSFNLANASALIARALETRPEDLRFEDLAFRPGTELAYITLSVVQAKGLPKPALVSVDASGAVTVVDLASTPHTSAELSSLPAQDKTLWRDLQEATLTVTDLLFRAGKLYVAGLSNATFASTLRVYDFPFVSAAVVSSVEMYHPVHNQLETRAPIRAMTIADLNGEPSLVAAYTCTPLVTIPLKELKDGAHVRGKTIAELGWGSAPVDMLTFESDQGPMVLLVNSHKSADLMSVSSIAEASKQPGLASPITWPTAPLLGLKSTYIPMAGVAQLGDQDVQFFGALRRDQESGAMQLMSIRKGVFLRLSDFVNEYDFAGFQYQPADPFRDLHKLLRTDEGYPDLAKRAEK